VVSCFVLKALFSSQILGPDSLCGKKILRHIKMPAHT
jgi:hypothetical protein